jgi:hypothetical protein
MPWPGSATDKLEPKKNEAHLTYKTRMRRFMAGAPSTHESNI